MEVTEETRPEISWVLKDFQYFDSGVLLGFFEEGFSRGFVGKVLATWLSSAMAASGGE